METPIDKLQIDIEAQSTDASTGIDKLITSLSKLRTASKGGAGLTTITKQMQRLSETLKSMQMPTQKITDLVAALKPLEQIQKSNLGSALNQLKKIPEITKGLSESALGEFANKIRIVTEAVRPLAAEMEKVSAGFSKLPANIQRAITANARLTSSNKTVHKSYSGIGSIFSAINVKLLAITYAAKRVGRVISGWVDESNKYIEDLNLFYVTMGKYADNAKKFAEYVGNLLGIDPREFTRYQGIFQNMITGFGVVSDKAVIMSKNLTQLGYDLASVFNVKFDEAMRKLESGIAGQPRPMREWGFDLSEATLKTFALGKGIEKNVEKMTQLEKSQLRYVQLIETAQRLNLTGDFARTLNAPSNQLRILKANAIQAARALGNIFIPALNAVLPYGIALMMVIRNVAQEIANMFGFALPKIDYSGLNNLVGGSEELEDSLGGATDEAEALKRAVLGFDELNILNFNKVGTSADGVGIDDLDLKLPEYNFIEGITESKVNELAEKLEKPFRKVLETVTLIGAGLLAWKITTSTITGLSALQTAIASLGGNVGGLITKFAGAAGLVYAMFGARDAAKKLAAIMYGDSKDSLGGAIGSLVGNVALGALGGFMLFGGPIGAVIGGLGALAMGIWTLIEEEDKYISRTVLADDFNDKGILVSDLTNKLADLFRPYSDYTKRQKNLNSQLETAKTRFNDADTAAGLLLTTLNERPELDSSDIEEMRTAFNNLFDAFTEVSRLEFDSVLGGLYQAIQMNLGASAQNEISNLITRLQELKRELGVAVEADQTRTNELLDKKRETGALTPQEQQELTSIYKRVADSMLDGSVSTSELTVLMEQLKQYGLAGNLDELKSELPDFISKYEELIKGIQVSTQQQKDNVEAIKKNLEKYGIDVSDIDWDLIYKHFDLSRDKMIDEIAGKYGNVANEIMNAIKEVTDENYNQFREGYKGSTFGAAAYSIAADAYAKEKVDEQYGDVLKSLEDLIKTIGDTITKTGGRVGKFDPPAMASGGVVRKPTTALIGEYPGASTNPEIVSPQNILYETVAEANAPLATAILSGLQRVEKAVREKDTTIEIEGEAIGKTSVKYIRNEEYRTGRNPVLSN